MAVRPLFWALIATVTSAHLAVAQPVGARGTGEATLERGRYLVQNVGMCVDCHGSRLRGAKLDFLAPGLPAAHEAPSIAGLPRLSTAQSVTFLTTGKLPNGATARPPMPQYRLRRDDAIAVTAYLKSLR